MKQFKTFYHSDINVVTKHLNNNLINKEDVVSLYYDGKFHVVVYFIERKYY